MLTGEVDNGWSFFFFYLNLPQFSSSYICVCVCVCVCLRIKKKKKKKKKGLGWVTCEEVKEDLLGVEDTAGTWNYKIPSSKSIPQEVKIILFFTV